VDTNGNKTGGAVKMGQWETNRLRQQSREIDKYTYTYEIPHLVMKTIWNSRNGIIW
jgi:hypothetical protein